MGLNYIIQGIMYLEKLIELVPAPANPVGNDDSSIVYKKLGIYLPEDYFNFLHVYGAGMFGNSLEVFSPFIKNPYMNFFNQIVILRDSYNSMKQLWIGLNLSSVFPTGSGYPFDFYPAEGGLIPWGCIEGCGTFFYWKPNYSGWEIVAYNDDEYQVFQMSMTEFIYNVFSSNIDFAGLSEISKKDLCFTTCQ